MKPYQIPMQINRNPKNAFTLVELMVAMALIILMLSIMSQAFVIATGTMQGLKEVADMQEKIRPAITLLQRVLGANHFEGSKKLSDPEFWDNGPPKEGYFMLWQDQAFEPLNGAEPSGYESSFNNVSFSRSAARANHMLAFTVKLPGKSPNELFECSSLASFGNIFYNVENNPPQLNPPLPRIPDTPRSMLDSNIRRFEKDSSLIHSDWAEVAYFLGPHVATNVNYPSPAPDGYTDGKSGPALPYYNLYRQQRLVLPSYNITGVGLPSANTTSNREEISSELYTGPSSTGTFNKPSDLTIPWKRMGSRNFNLLGSQIPVNPPTNPITYYPLFSEYSSAAKIYTDIIATNVISFDVKLLTDSRFDFEDLFTIGRQTPYINHDAIFNYSTPPPINTRPTNLNRAVFDTWTTDQGNGPNSVPRYDLGVYGAQRWRPTTYTQNYTDTNNLPLKSYFDNYNMIPFWNWNNNTGLNIKAIQISLRVWDQKSNTAKMFVIVQKL